MGQIHMGITIAQLEILGNKYGFSLEDARKTLGLSDGKRGPKTQNIEMRLPSVPTHKPAKKAVNTPSDKKGSKSGYHLYMSDVSSRVKSDLMAQLGPGEKLPRGAVMSEVSKRWKNLPECSRAHWNNLVRA